MGRDLDELKPALRWLGREIEVHDSLDSTNLRAEQRAREGAPQGTIVLADRQTAGRGRLGRSFFSPGQRSLYLSVILRPACPPEEVHQAVFAAAVAVAETVRGRVPASVPVEIKWPNDVLLGGRKTSGINLPAHVEGGRVHWAILGIGLNVNTAASEFPAELREIATSLSIAAGSPLDRVAVAGELLGRLEGQLDLLSAGRFGEVLEGWRNYFRMQGSRVIVGGPGTAREIQGTVTGIDDGGALLLETSAGPERILAGDVTLLARENPTEA